jgi:two-component system CheB/CheR fusion protein
LNSPLWQVDCDLRIVRFTPASTRIINLIQSDTGRPLAHIVYNLKGYDHLLADTRTVLDTLSPKEIEVQTNDGAWHLMRILPYRTLENVIEGAVLTFVDISAAKKAQTSLLEARN